MRKVAAHRIEKPDGTMLTTAVCEIEGETVVRIKKLNGEEAMVEWLDGSIVCRTGSAGSLQAYYNQELLKEK